MPKYYFDPLKVAPAIPSAENRLRDYPPDRATSREKKELLSHRIITLVASGLPIFKIALKLKRTGAHTYRLLEREGCKSVLLTPNEQRALERDRAHRRKKKKARSRRSNDKLTDSRRE